MLTDKEVQNQTVDVAESIVTFFWHQTPMTDVMNTIKIETPDEVEELIKPIYRSCQKTIGNVQTDVSFVFNKLKLGNILYILYQRCTAEKNTHNFYSFLLPLSYSPHPFPLAIPGIHFSSPYSPFPLKLLLNFQSCSHYNFPSKFPFKLPINMTSCSLIARHEHTDSEDISDFKKNNHSTFMQAQTSLESHPPRTSKEESNMYNSWT